MRDQTLTVMPADPAMENALEMVSFPFSCSEHASQHAECASICKWSQLAYQQGLAYPMHSLDNNDL